jgi:NAD(P)-dependent dehydrogenase (short-subunit alcohol dehydrogenase family)
MRNLELSGKHALVTGAGSGIGAAIARALSVAGARVTLAGRRARPLEAVASTLTSSAFAIVTFDVTDAAAVEQGAATARAMSGPIDIIVNNAHQAESAIFEKTDLELFSRMLTVNLTGAFLCTKAALPDMLEKENGRVINVTSTAALAGHAYVVAYAAAMHGVIGMTRALALEVAARGVTVNAVCPGYTDTSLLASTVESIAAKTGRSREEARAVLARASPMGRLVTPEEVADTVVWLASPGAAAINGQAIAVAGGEVACG